MIFQVEKGYRVAQKFAGGVW